MTDLVRFYFHAGRFITPGHDYGPKGVKVVWRNDPYMILKHGGYMGWLSMMSRCYYPTTYDLVRIEADEAGDTFYDIIRSATPNVDWAKLIKDWKFLIKIAVGTDVRIMKK